jgi:F-type H+-transporting ATPase subunit delta
MRSTAAARRYARALFALARETGRVPDVRSELDAMAELFDDNPDLTRSLFRPLHPAAERRAVLGAVSDRIGVSATVRNFCAFLIDQRRLVDFRGIHEEYGHLADAAAGRTRAAVVSAAPLREDQRERLRHALSARTGQARTGQEVELSETVDSSLLGGAIATIGGLVFDGSLRTQLSQLRATLTRGH